MVTPELKTQLFMKRNEIIKEFNELLKKRKYLEASLVLEEAITISKQLGDFENANLYSRKIEQCIAKIKEIAEDIQIIKSEPELKEEFLKERARLIEKAQNAAQNQQIQEACEYYRKAAEISLKLEDKKSVWKLSKTILLLEEKTKKEILPATQTQIKGQSLSVTTISSPPPSFRPSPAVTPPLTKEKPIEQRQSETLSKKPIFQTPTFTQTSPTIKQEVPFFKTVVVEQEPVTQKKPEKKKEKKIDKKLQKKVELEKKIAKKKLEKAEKEFLKRTKKEEEMARKKAEKEAKKREKEAKKKAKEAKKKAKELEKKKKKEAASLEKPSIQKVGKSALAPDVLAEIRSFDHKNLDSITPEKREKKKPTLGRSLLPADVLEELKKKADKSSE